jgi:hypothetical protein
VAFGYRHHQVRAEGENRVTKTDARNYACPSNEAAPSEHKIISHTCIVSRHRRILVRVPTAAIAAQVMMLARVELEGAPPA